MKIKLARRSKYLPPSWWDYIVKHSPKIHLPFLEDYILNHPRYKELIKAIPSQCPFERAYELHLKGKEYLICYIPALCHFNPLYEWLIDLKISIWEEERKEKEKEIVKKELKSQNPPEVGNVLDMLLKETGS